MPTLNSVNVSGNSATWNWSHTAVGGVSDPGCPAVSRITYKVWRKPTGTGTWNLVTTLAASATTYTESSIPNGEYDFRVTATEQSWTNFDGTCLSFNTDVPSNTITKVVGQDTTPDVFNLGADKTNAATSTYYTSSTVTITGINAATSVSISGGGQYRKNGGSWTSAAGTVVANDTLQVRLQSSPNFNTTLTTTLNVGGVTDQFKVTTQNPGGQITMPSSGAISYDDIRAMWGPAPGTNVTMFDWRRNGPYWQNYPENAGVPTGNPISLSDFYGCIGIWTVDPLPSTLGGSTTTSVGYTPQNPSQPLEYKWVAGSVSPVHSVSGPAWNTWSTIGSVTVSHTGSSSTGNTTLVCYARPLGGYGGASNEVALGNVLFIAGDGGPLI